MAPSVLTQPPTSKLQSINIRSMIPELSRVSNQGLVSGLGLGLGLGLGTLSHRNASSSVALSVAFDSCRQVMSYAYTHAWPIIASDEHRARFAK